MLRSSADYKAQSGSILTENLVGLIFLLFFKFICKKCCPRLDIGRFGLGSREVARKCCIQVHLWRRKKRREICTTTGQCRMMINGILNKRSAVGLLLFIEKEKKECKKCMQRQILKNEHREAEHLRKATVR